MFIAACFLLKNVIVARLVHLGQLRNLAGIFLFDIVLLSDAYAFVGFLSCKTLLIDSVQLEVSAKLNLIYSNVKMVKLTVY